ncbi:MAG: class I tRNA ligase family protein, partial [Chloroflexota bacterium]
IEPLVSKQWFVNTKPLAEPAIKAVVDGRIDIIPSRFTKVYLNWMENIRDWCISRQLWWGHRIPVWYCRDCGKLTVAIEEPKECVHCGSKKIEQDPDVLDTWFSSGLWTHSTLGWPDDTPDFRYFYPTTVMETAYDILFFWVARMIMMGLEDTGEIPFCTVYLHGLIRDERGEKMSKIKGNVINPMVTVEQYGADALRFAVITGTSPGNDSKLTAAKLESGRNFANKLWNATRFVLRSIEPGRTSWQIEKDLPTEGRWILSKINQVIASVNNLLIDFRFEEAQRQVYDFLWGDFCDWYIELAKIRLRTGSAPSPIPVLVNVLETSLRLLHPFMPFITEELWQSLPDQKKGESIMVAPYPEADSKAINLESEQVMDSVIEIVRSIRNARAEHNVESSRWVEAQIYGGRLTKSILPYSQAIESLARAKPVTILETRKEAPQGENALVMVLKEATVVIPIESMVDLAAEKRRLQEEIEQAQAEIGRLETRLNDKMFLEKAPAPVIDKERQKLYNLATKLERLKEQIAKY